MTPTMKSANSGQSNTPAPMIDHCAQIETLPTAGCPRRTHETPGRHQAAFGNGKAVSAAICRSHDLNNQPENGQLNTQPEQERKGDRRKQGAEQAAFQFRRFALLPPGGNPIFKNRGKIRHDTFLSTLPHPIEV
jgi:hypothetical protein